MLEKTLESPLDCKEIQPVHPKGDQAWIFIGRTDAEGEAPILWSPNAKNWLTGKDPDAGKDGGEWDDRGWDGWMASLTQWTWVWASSGSWWWTGKPDVVQSVGLQSQTWLSDWTTRAQQQISLLLNVPTHFQNSEFDMMKRISGIYLLWVTLLTLLFFIF